MLLAGLVEVFLGVDAERKSLEEIAAPLSEVGDDEAADADGSAKSHGHRRDHPAPLPGRGRSPSAGWSPAPLASTYPRHDPYRVGEVDALVAALRARSPLSRSELARATAARAWGPGRFRQAMRSGLASGHIRHLGHDRYALGKPGLASVEDQFERRQ